MAPGCTPAERFDNDGIGRLVDVDREFAGLAFIRIPIIVLRSDPRMTLFATTFEFGRLARHAAEIIVVVGLTGAGNTREE